MTTAAASESAIFQKACALPPGERPAYLEAVCGGDERLRSEVESLLAAHDPGDDFLAAPGPAVTIDRPLLERPGTVIGPYKLVEQIGEGGFGVVFMAQQTEPVRRLVALKIVKPGMDSRQVIGRFEAERQALALMDHPNIAKVLDAGTTDGGRPYFVMELVKGVPITRYCDQQHLTPRQRLELLVPVCQAIQHAHHKGIIHRDLKPSNVLIALYDDKPVPKVIDFGVAKATGQQLTEQTLHTGFGAVVGTVEYMSPEQASFNQLDVDTRSDVYSLGVLLYELLTGSTPFSRKELEKAGMLEMLRVIREQEPARPSTKLSTAEGLPTLAANRGSEPAKLTRLVRGELDWIVMKALEKDRSRRYESASGLARDLERYLADEQVQACPPSAGYRLRKFARRNKRALATATLAGLMLLVSLGAVAGSIGWLVRDQEARRTKLAGQLELILEEVEQRESEQKWPDALGAAERAEALVSGGGGDAALEKQVRAVLADLTLVQRLEDIWLELAGRTAGNNHEWANHAYGAAFQEYGIDLDQSTAQQAAERLGSRPVAVPLAARLDHWAYCRRGLGDDNGSRKLMTMASQIDPDPWRRKLREAMARQDLQAVDAMADSANLVSQPAPTLYLLGSLLSQAEKPQRAIEVLRQAQGTYPGDYWLNNLLARCLNSQVPPQTNEAVGFYRVAVALRPHKAQLHNTLGACLSQQGKLEEAIACYQRAIELDPKLAWAHGNLGNALRAQKKLDEAIACYKKAIELVPYAAAHHALGLALLDQKKHDEAIACYKKAIELYPKYAGAHNSLGLALREQKKLDEAIVNFKKAIQLDPKYAVAHNNLGLALREQKKLDEAIVSFQKAIELNPKSALAHFNLGLTLAAQKKPDEAIACYRKAIELDPKLAGAHANLGRALAAQNKLDEAIACHRKAIELAPNVTVEHVSLGLALAAQNKLDEAIACYRKAIKLDPMLAIAHYSLGRALAVQNKLDEAITCYRKAIELDPKNAGFQYHLGNALTNQQMLDEAAACYRQAIELDPNNAAAHHNLGLILRHQKYLDEAIASFRTAVELNPNLAAAHHNLGLSLRDQKQLDEAIASFRKAIELDPNSALTYRDLGLAINRQNKLDEAIACYRKAIELDPKFALAQYNLGSALAAQQKLDDAITCFQKAIELDAKLTLAYYSLGAALAAQKKLDEAVACYRTLVELVPESPRAHTTLGVALAAQNKPDEAIVCYRRAIEINPQYAMAHNNLAWLRATCSDAKLREPAEAVAAAQKAAELSPQNPLFPSTLGAAYYRSGEWQAAIAAFEKSMELRSGGDSIEWFLLAMTHRQLGDKDKAREWYDRAAEWMDKNQPANEELRRFRSEAAELLGIAAPESLP